MPYNFGENSVISFLKGNENTRCNVTFWGKLHDFKEIFKGEGTCERPLLKKEKKALTTKCTFGFRGVSHVISQTLPALHTSH
jgi:hypothetical protein